MAITGLQPLSELSWNLKGNTQVLENVDKINTFDKVHRNKSPREVLAMVLKAKCWNNCN